MGKTVLDIVKHERARSVFTVKFFFLTNTMDCEEKDKHGTFRGWLRDSSKKILSPQLLLPVQ
jgi:hypothetical protein